MIVIMGATGNVGGAALNALVSSGRSVRAISRQPRPAAQPGVKWVTADATDAASLARAFDGASVVFVMNPASPDAADVRADAERLSATVAQALDRAGVTDVVALSSQGAHRAEGTGVVLTLHDFERHLRQTGARVTFIRPAYFMENWSPLAQVAAETGQMPAFLHPVDHAVDTVAARDVGAIVAEYLMQPVTGIVNVTGPRKYSDSDAAEILSQLLGRDIRPDPVPQDQIAAALEAEGLGASFAAGTAALYHAMNADGLLFQEDIAVQRSGTTTLKDVLQTALSG